MPLVVFCGIPAAGKTSVAEALVKYLHENQQEEVVHITEASVNVNRIEGYKDSRAEKMTRSALKAAVEHAVNSKTIVILDSLNYIKGFRYELFCKAKAESTTYCVVYVDTPVQVALERNAISSPNRTEQFDSTM
jgi:protein KTI12